MTKARTMLIVMLCSMLAATAASVDAQSYSLNSLRGSYVFRGYGTVQGVDAPSVGRTVYDGSGGCQSRLFLNLGGTLLDFRTDVPGGSCTYTVEPMGFSLLSLAYVGAQGPAAFDVHTMIVDDEDMTGEVFWIASDSTGATVGRGLSKKQNPGVFARSYAARSFRGSWAFRTTGTVQGVDTPAVGRIRYDGAGTCSDAESWILNFGGALVPLGPANVCEYTVSPEGLYESTYVGSLADGTPAAFNWVGYVIDDSFKHGELWAVIMDPNGTTVGRGLGKKQNP